MGVEESYQEQFAVQAIISFRLKMNLIEPAERLLLLHQETRKSENKQKGENSRPPSELRQLWGEGKKRKNCVMKGVIQTHHANYLHNVSL